MNKNKRYGLRTWIEIDTKAIKHNLKIFRSLIKSECLMMAVVKSNAYGHDLISFAKIAEKFGVDYLGVDSAVEGIALRHNGIKKPILVLGYTLPEIIKEATKNNLSLSISNLDALNSLIALKLKKPVKIHLKVDTGMHRQGFSLKEAKELIKKIKAHKKKIIVEGLFTLISPRPKTHPFPAIL
jgi:alanine racemase